jgi:hypothetical protein
MDMATDVAHRVAEAVISRSSAGRLLGKSQSCSTDISPWLWPGCLCFLHWPQQRSKLETAWEADLSSGRISAVARGPRPSEVRKRRHPPPPPRIQGTWRAMQLRCDAADHPSRAPRYRRVAAAALQRRFASLGPQVRAWRRCPLRLVAHVGAFPRSRPHSRCKKLGPIQQPIGPKWQDAQRSVCS